LLFLVGAFVGGVLSALVLWLSSGLMQPIPRDARIGALAAIALVAVLRDWGIVHIPLPENKRQIPQTVFGQSPPRAALQFGFEMGTGVRTFLTATSPYLLASFILLSSSGAGGALAAGAGFGIGRGMIPAMRGLARDPQQWDDAIDRWSRQLVRVTTLVACVCTIALAIRLV
jgi:hypothetical protein